MQKILRILMCFMVFLFLFGGCEESKRFEISVDDNTPPKAPIFVESEPLPGGAKIRFTPPTDKDVLYIEASYVNNTGKTLRYTASFTAGSVSVYGFSRDGKHTVELCAVDRAGNRSESISCMVEANEPPAVTLAKSLNVVSSFSSMLLKWENISEVPLYVWVDFSYIQNGVRREHTTVFNTNQTEIRSIDSLKLITDEQVSIKVNVRDKYDNLVHAKDTSIVLLTDELIPKDKWTLLTPGTVMGDITQVDGLRMELVTDGIIDIDVENYFITTQANPWSLIIDLGEQYELSRVITHQRWTGYNSSVGAVDARGNLYRGENVLTSNFYRWDETAQSWDFLSRYEITPPFVISDGEYKVLGKAGDMAFIFPEEPQYSKPTRFFRFEAINGLYISEITLYGRRAN